MRQQRGPGLVGDARCDGSACWEQQNVWVSWDMNQTNWGDETRGKEEGTSRGRWGGAPQMQCKEQSLSHSSGWACQCGRRQPGFAATLSHAHQRWPSCMGRAEAVAGLGEATCGSTPATAPSMYSPRLCHFQATGSLPPRTPRNVQPNATHFHWSKHFRPAPRPAIPAHHDAVARVALHRVDVLQARRPHVRLNVVLVVLVAVGLGAAAIWGRAAR